MGTCMSKKGRTDKKQTLPPLKKQDERLKYGAGELAQ